MRGGPGAENAVESTYDHLLHLTFSVTVRWSLSAIPVRNVPTHVRAPAPAAIAVIVILLLLLFSSPLALYLIPYHLLLEPLSIS